MVYNPNWKKRGVPVKRRIPPKGSGIRHSDIMRRRGVGTAAPMGEETKTLHGFRKEIVSCDKFTQYYECIYSGNATSFGFNTKGLKTFRVEKGTVFVTTADVTTEGVGKGTTYTAGPRTSKKVHEGGYITLPAKLAYSIATSGDSSAELVVTETAKYEASWKELDIAVSNLDDDILRFDPAEATEHTPKVRENRRKTKAYEQAQRMSSRRTKQQVAKGRPARFNANSSSAVGDNLKPMTEADLLAE